MKNDLLPTFKSILIYIFSFLLCFYSIVFVISLSANIPFLKFVKYLSLSVYTFSYNQNHNLIKPPYIQHTNYYFFVYSALLLSFAILSLIGKKEIALFTSIKKNIYKLGIHLILTTFFLLVCVQLASFQNHFIKEYYTFANKSVEQKYSEIMKQVFYLSKVTKAQLPGYHKSRLITDLNIKKDPGAIYYRVFAHFLYPIDIRNIRKNDATDSILIFFKKNAIDHIPEGYELHFLINEGNVIAKLKN